MVHAIDHAAPRFYQHIGFEELTVDFIPTALTAEGSSKPIHPPS